MSARNKQRGYFAVSGAEVIATLIAFAFAGWAVIEGLIWIVRHVALVIR